ncbi:MAG: hypothetical protein WC797_00415 [Candidatus Paceibacterota bacterium]|jgi:hypothetical protein
MPIDDINDDLDDEENGAKKKRQDAFFGFADNDDGLAINAEDDFEELSTD